MWTQWELKDRNCSKTEISLCLCSAGAAAPSSSGLFRASCLLLQSRSVLSHLWEDSGFLHQTVPVRVGAAALPGPNDPPSLSALPEFLASFSLQHFPLDSVVWKLVVCHGTECSASLSMALRNEHFGCCCVSLRFDRFFGFFLLITDESQPDWRDMFCSL